MLETNVPSGARAGELLTELAAAAYRVALRHGFKGAFIDMELDLWQALQAQLGRVAPGNAGPSGKVKEQAGRPQSAITD